VQGAYVHNIAAEIVGEQGLLGATVFTLAILVAIRAGYRLWRLYAHDPSMRATATLAVALGAYSLFQALKQGTITSGQPFFWWLVLTKIAAHEQRVRAFDAVEYEAVDDSGEAAYPETAYARSA
jgi:O-antigen ligase